MKIKAEDGILYGSRIFKNKDYNIDREDIGWQKDIEHEDIVIEFRIFLEDVTGWEEWKGVDADPRYRYTGPLVVIEKSDGDKNIALCSIRELDQIMRDYRKSLTLQFKHN